MAGRFSFSVPSAGTSAIRGSASARSTSARRSSSSGLSVASMFVYAIDRTTLGLPRPVPGRGPRGQLWRIVTWPLANDPDLWTVITLAIFWYFGREIEGRSGAPLRRAARSSWRPSPGSSARCSTSRGRHPADRVRRVPGLRRRVPVRPLLLRDPGLGARRRVRRASRCSSSSATGRRSASSCSSCRSPPPWSRPGAMGLCEASPWIPALPWGQGSGRSSSGRPTAQEAARGGGGVVAGPWAPRAPDRPTRSSLPQPPAPASAGSADDHSELDALLDKISAGGLDALSTAEKRRLNELSKRIRGSRDRTLAPSQPLPWPATVRCHVSSVVEGGLERGTGLVDGGVGRRDQGAHAEEAVDQAVVAAGLRRDAGRLAASPRRPRPRRAAGRTRP